MSVVLFLEIVYFLKNTKEMCLLASLRSNFNMRLFNAKGDKTCMSANWLLRLRETRSTSALSSGSTFSRSDPSLLSTDYLLPLLTLLYRICYSIGPGPGFIYNKQRYIEWRTTFHHCEKYVSNQTCKGTVPPGSNMIQ